MLTIRVRRSLLLLSRNEGRNKRIVLASDGNNEGRMIGWDVTVELLQDFSQIRPGPCILKIDKRHKCYGIAGFPLRVSQFLGREALRYQFRVNSQMALTPSGLPSLKKNL